MTGEHRAERMRTPGFGRVLTEHIVSITWTADRGWHDAVLRPYDDLRLAPACVGLHYGQSVFEGLKAYTLADGRVGVFRPDAAARRMRRSARRLAMPQLPEAVFVDAVDALLQADRAWVPSRRGQSLYLRPLLFASEADLSLRPAHEYTFLLMAFVTDGIFEHQVKPLRVWLCEDHVRAAPGGTGEAKCAGNYAPTLLSQQQAKERGCDQVVWLDAVERSWVEELGGMNIFFVMGPAETPRLVTPPLGGTILPGVTRDSLITLAADMGWPTLQQPMSVAQWRAACAGGEMLEAFACGTAAVVTPIGTVVSTSDEWVVGGGAMGPVTRRLRDALMNLHYGTAPDTHGWVHVVPGTG
ncbi:branched chain amino acid aminotransferase [Actinosynnema sp. ALI-1.44]|uniref:branched-chain amino acid aminotransferase n=1 Tax=Actinosynnema sp. ALI-1.44 TaxID=1933779 RepID=UPI00097C0D24|nr:branched-chain amino acid aminotransferase [Actinosynnema sp. ALI-1.44]ONI76014.1 branched chain amino acid aminotransferase [Actinosynnema sp. ALI-1.44]